MVWKINDIGTLSIDQCVQPCFTPDSRLVFIASALEARLYNVNNGELIRILKHPSKVSGIFLPHGNSEVLTTTSDGVIRIWNYEEGVEIMQHNIGKTILRVKGDTRTNTIVMELKTEETKGFSDCELRLYEFKSLQTKDGKDTFYSTTWKEVGKVTSIDIVGNCVAITASIYLTLWEPTVPIQKRIAASSIIPTYSRSKKRTLLAVAINPADVSFIAAGDSFGQIHYFRLDENQQIHYAGNYNWHSFGCTALTFFPDGNGLLSGGTEGVLLQWDLDRHKFKRLNSLGTISQICISHNEYIGAVLTSENLLLTADLVVMETKNIMEGQKRETYEELPSDWLRSPHIQVDNYTSQLVMNGAKGSLQFLDVASDCIVASLEVVPPNTSTFSGPSSNKEIPNPHVDHFCLGSNGKGMAATVYRNVVLANRHKFVEDTLRFYWRNRFDKWTLETRVDLPHGDKVTHLAYHPSKDIVVSCGTDGKFRVWNRTLIKEVAEVENKKKAAQETSQEEHGRWVCRSVGHYKTSACTSCAFSPDGSLLAVGYDNMLTLWNPISNILLSEIYHPDSKAIKHINFIADTSYVITCTESRLFVWNVLDSSLLWSFEGNLAAVAVHPTESIFAVSVLASKIKIPPFQKHAKGQLKNKHSYVVLFSANSPKPLYSWKMSADKIPVAMTFGKKDISHSSKYVMYWATPLQSTYLVEDLTSEIEAEKPAEAVPIQEERKPGYLESLTAMEEDEETSMELDSGRRRIMIKRRDQFLTTFAETPSHVLPPATALFRAMMESIITKDPSFSQKNEQTQETIKNLEEEKKSEPAALVRKKSEYQVQEETPSDSKHLPKPVLDLVNLFHNQLSLQDFQQMGATQNAALGSSGKKRSETPQKSQPALNSNNKSASKDLKKKKVDEEPMEEQPTNGSTSQEQQEPVVVGSKRTSEDRIVQNKREANGVHSQNNQESETTPKSERKQSLKTSQTKSAPTTPAAHPPKGQKQTPKSALRQSGSKQRQ